MKEIKKYLESRIGKYSFFFEDLKSGYVYGYNENVSMTAIGSLSKSASSFHVINI